MIRQLHYTSAETGPDGVQGFQVTAATDGIPERHQDLAIQLSAYRVPPGLPLDPTAQDVRACPVRFGYLPTGDAAVLFRSVYTGADFTGRQGNYFAHALVMRGPDELGQLPPIALWDAPVWATNRAPSHSLPTLDRLHAGPLADPAAIRRFLLRGDRLDRLADLLTAMIPALASGSRRVVLVCEDSTAAAYWLGAALTSLPRSLALGVSFATFSAAPVEDEAAVVATTPDVPVRPSPFSPHVLVDLTDAGGAAEPAAAPVPYGTAVAAAWRAGTDDAAGLASLAQQVAPPLTWTELDPFATSWGLLSDHPAPDGRVIDGAEFALRRLPPPVRARLWETVGRQLTGDAELAEPETWSPLLAEAADAGGRLPASVEAGYLRGVLTAAAARPAGRDDAAAGLWLPDLTRPRVEATVSGWLRARLAGQPPGPGTDDPGAAGPARCAAVAARFADACSAAEQTRIADLLRGVLLDPGAGVDEVWRALARLPRGTTVLACLVAMFEQRLGARDGFSVVVDALSGAGAGVLGAAAGPASPLAPIVTLAAARSRGGKHRLTALREIAGARRRSMEVRTVVRLVDVLWRDDLPTAAEANGILDLVEESGASSLAATTFPETIVELLLTDAQGQSGLTEEDGRLAARLLADEDAAAALPVGARRTLDAVRLDAYFRALPGSDREQSLAARHAVRLYGQVETAVGGALLDAVGWWLPRVADPQFHLATLEDLDKAGGKQFRAAYLRRATELAATAQPAQLVPLVAVWLAFSRTSSFGQRLLDRELPAALAGRRSHDLDGMAAAFRAAAAELKPLSSALDPICAGDWARWWKQWRSRNLRSFLGRVRLAGNRRG